MESPPQYEVPAVVRQGIVVQGGSNFDLARGAVPTPVQRVIIPAPPPVAPVVAVELPLPLNLEKTGYPAQSGIAKYALATSVEFGRNSAVLHPQAIDRDLLKQLRLARGQSKGARAIVVAGHADAGEEAHQKLAMARATAITKALRNHGIRAEPRSFADALPLTEVPEFRTRNRRAEILLAPSNK